MKKFLIGLLAVVVALPLLGVAGFMLFFDADAFRPRAERAASQALGHPVRIEGPLTLRPALTPSLGASRITATGADGAPILSIADATLRLAILPLTRGHVEVDRLELTGGVLRLDAAAWVRAAAPEAATPAPSPGEPREPMTFDLRAARLADWRVTHGGETFTLAEATLTSPSAGAPLALAARGEWRATPLVLEGEVAPPQAWMGTGEAPFALNLTAAGARLAVEGQRRGAVVQGRVSGEIPALAALSPLVGQPLPALTGVSLRAEGGLGEGPPRFSNLELRATGGEAMGITVAALEARLPALDAPLEGTARLTWRGAPLEVAWRAPPTALMAGQPAEITARIASGQAVMTVAGNWPQALRLEADVPELAALSPLAGRPLPALTGLALRAELAPRGQEGVSISRFTAESSAGDLGGTLELGWASRPRLTGQVRSRRLDLGALRLPAASAGAPAPAAPAPAPAEPARLIPATPLDLAFLRDFDADLRFTLAELVQPGLTATAVEGRFVNAAGEARLNPFAANVPGGRLSLRVAADARGQVPLVQVSGGGQGLDLAALLASIGTQAPTGGQADLEMDLRGQGGDLRALAATLTGHLGVAVIDARLGGGLGQTLQQLTPLLGPGAPLACLAFRTDVEQGLARVTTLFLDGAAGRVAGEGNIRLADEALAMRLLTDLRVAGLRVRAPVPVTGRLMAPRLESAGIIAGALGGGGMPSLPDCATTLRIARGGRDGPVPANPTPAANDTAPAEGAIPGAPPVVNELLRGFLRR